MFTKSRQKKSCRSTPVAIDCKLKPLPNIGNCAASKMTGAPACKSRNSATVSKSSSRSNDHNGRSGSVTDRGRQPVRSGKMLQAVSKRLHDNPKYNTYGRSSDTNIASSDAVRIPPFLTGRSSDPCYEDPLRRHALPDPYADLKSNLDNSVPLDPNAPWWLFLAEMKLQARRQSINLDSKSDTLNARPEDKLDGSLETKQDGGKTKRLDTKVESKPDTSEKYNDNGRQSNKSEDDAKCGTDNDESPVGVSSVHRTQEHGSEEDSKGKDETVGHDDNDEEDDEEEDESGLPQAVRASQSKPSTPNAREVVRERHRTMMEEIARTISKNNLMSYLRTEGFFNYDYSQHARTSLTNHNLRKGKKKGIERLLLLLACRPAKCTGELFSTA